MSKIEKALSRAKQDRRSLPTGQPEPPKRETKPSPLVKTIQYTQTEVMAYDPAVLTEKKVMFNQDGRFRAAVGYQLLKAQILKKARDKHWNTIMVTSVGKGEGKTLTAINLALAISLELQETSLLVEADLREPTLRRYFGINTKQGLTDYLLSGTPLPELLINPGIDRFVFLPGGHSIHNSAEMLGSPKMQDLVAEMKHYYPDRYMVFDLPPLFECADPLIFSEYVDGILLVAEAYQTTVDQLHKAMELLEGKNILGAVLNKVKAEDKRYYRYYRYYR
jgi:protein-tyrosine kinase